MASLVLISLAVALSTLAVFVLLKAIGLRATAAIFAYAALKAFEFVVVIALLYAGYLIISGSN